MNYSFLPVFLLLSAAACSAIAQTPFKTPYGQLSAHDPEKRPERLLHRLGATRIAPLGGVGSIAVSPDGRWMATGDRASSNCVYVWDLQTGKARWVLSGHSEWVSRLQFSVDSEYLLVGYGTHAFGGYPPFEMAVWMVKTGEVVKYHNFRYWSLSADGKTLAVARPNAGAPPMSGGITAPLLVYKGFTVDIFDFPSHEMRRSIRHPDKPIESVALSPDGTMLAVGSPNQILRWDTSTGKELSAITGLKDMVHLLNFSPDGKILASASDDIPENVPRALELWDPNTGKAIGAFKTDKGYKFGHVEFLRNGLALTKIDFTDEYQLWSLETLKAVRTFGGKWGAIAVFGNGKSIAHNRNDKSGHRSQIYFEDSATGKPLDRKTFNEPGLGPWKFSEDGKVLFTRTLAYLEPSLVQAWDTGTGKEMPERRGTRDFPYEQETLAPVTDLGDGRQLEYLSKENTLRVVDTLSSRELARREYGNSLRRWVLSANKQSLAVWKGSIYESKQFITVIDLRTYKDITNLQFPASQSISRLALVPDGSALAILEQEGRGKLHLYDVATGKLRLQHQPAGGFIFSRDGKRLATVNGIGTVDLIDLSERKN